MHKHNHSSSYIHWQLLTLNQFLSFPCGVVRGALAALGIVATVQAEINDLPGAIFQIKTVSTKS
jgi:trafficking protein particle complex subunit 6